MTKTISWLLLLAVSPLWAETPYIIDTPITMKKETQPAVSPGNRVVQQKQVVDESIRLVVDRDDGRYVGRVKDGKPHGFGYVELKNGDSYNGTWNNGELNGPGEYNFTKRNKLWQGPFAACTPTGLGVLIDIPSSTKIFGITWEDANAGKQEPSTPPAVQIAQNPPVTPPSLPPATQQVPPVTQTVPPIVRLEQSTSVKIPTPPTPSTTPSAPATPPSSPAEPGAVVAQAPSAPGVATVLPPPEVTTTPAQTPVAPPPAVQPPVAVVPPPPEEPVMVTNRYPNGDRYEGMMFGGRKNGAGHYWFRDGREYNGNFVDGQFSGLGTLTDVDGSAYQGQWVFGVMQGYGSNRWSNGDAYVGRWNMGKREGQGVFVSAKGLRYDGPWKNDGMHGNGVLVFEDLRRYEGSFVDNEMSGKGVMTWPDGRTYTGDWARGKRNGEGTETLANQDHFTGKWVEDRAIRGPYTHADGRQEEAWQDEPGKWVFKTSKAVREKLGREIR